MSLWPQYVLEDRTQWPQEGTLEFFILYDLENLCEHGDMPACPRFLGTELPTSQCLTAPVLLARVTALPDSRLSGD